METPVHTLVASKSKKYIGEKAKATRAELLKAGIKLFSQQGFEATSTRQIETEASVQRNLMSYHFGNKEAFWKSCMVELSERMNSILRPAFEQSRDIAPRERLRFLIRRFVRASAEVPEVSRIMFDEGRAKTWRLEWLIDHGSRELYTAVGQLYDDGRAQGMIPDIPLINYYYLLVTSSSLFSVSAECELLTGVNPCDDAMVDIQAETIANLLTIPSPPQ